MKKLYFLLCASTLLLSACGPSEREVELEKELQQVSESLASITAKHREVQDALDSFQKEHTKTLEALDSLKAEHEEALAKLEESEKKLADTNSKLADIEQAKQEKESALIAKRKAAISFLDGKRVDYDWEKSSLFAGHKKSDNNSEVFKITFDEKAELLTIVQSSRSFTRSTLYFGSSKVRKVIIPIREVSPEIPYTDDSSIKHYKKEANYKAIAIKFASAVELVAKVDSDKNDTFDEALEKSYRYKYTYDFPESIEPKKIEEKGAINLVGSNNVISSIKQALGDLLSSYGIEPSPY